MAGGGGGGRGSDYVKEGQPGHCFSGSESADSDSPAGLHFGTMRGLLLQRYSAALLSFISVKLTQ